MDLHPPVVPEIPIDPFSLDTVRADRFPEAGPLPWLDQDDADARIDAREAAGELSADQAALCRQFRERGYVSSFRASSTTTPFPAPGTPTKRRSRREW